MLKPMTHKKRLKQAIVALTTILAVACKTSPTAENKGLSADFFLGNLPCADCAAIRTLVHLEKNNQLSISRQYVGKSDSLFTVKAKFKYHAETRRIAYESSNEKGYFLYSPEKLIQLDQNGNKINGKLAPRYVLNRDTLSLYRFWNLMQMQGKPVENVGKTSIHLRFRPKKLEVSGFAGCNRLNGKFTVQAQKIAIGPVATTKMACERSETESAFLQCLKEVQRFEIRDETLLLWGKSPNPLLEFQVSRLD
jgi:copper homeostasis protein (lipoprotein)